VAPSFPRDILFGYIFEQQDGRRRLLIMGEGGNVHELDADSYAYLSRHESAFMVHSFTPQIEKRRIFFASAFQIASVMSLDNLAETRRGVWGSVSWGIDYDAQTDHLYVSDFFIGRIYKVEIGTMKTVESRLLQPGIRPVVFDPHRRLVYVGDYFSRSIFVLDADLRKLGKIRCAGKLREMKLSADGQTLYLAGWNGAYAIHLEDALKSLK
jgi:hypothetical protein